MRREVWILLLLQAVPPTTIGCGNAEEPSNAQQTNSSGNPTGLSSTTGPDTSPAMGSVSTTPVPSATGSAPADSIAPIQPTTNVAPTDTVSPPVPDDNSNGGETNDAPGASGSGGASPDGSGGSATPGGGSGNANGGSTTAAAGAGGAGGSTAGAGGNPATDPGRVLLYSFSTLDIPSVPAQLSILGGVLEGWGFEVDESTDPGVFRDENLQRYAAVGMINTCFYPFGENRSGDGDEAQALQRFLDAGGGLFGTHCADVTFQSANPPALYSELIGGRASARYFEGVSDCRTMGDHPTVANLPATFEYNGNLDATDFIAADTTVLVSCTWRDGSATDTPVSWVRTEGNGRVFFTSFAKVDSDLTNPTFGEPHIIAGLGWVLGR